MNNTKEIGKFAALLSFIELGLGSFLHSFKIPFSGQLLSLNQVFILTRASIKIKEKSSGALISNTSALLKSLSPAGKKLTPMLAISAQGNLFTFGVYFFGNNIIGRLFGAFLSSLWSYIQPLCIYLILFGKDLYFMAQYFLAKLNKVFTITENQILSLILMIIFIKVILSFILVIAAHYLSDKHFSFYESWAKRQKIKKTKKETSPIKGAIRDLMNPLFLLSLSLMTLFFIYSKADLATLIWQFLRPIALGFVIFYILRVFPLERFAQKLKNGKYKEVLIEALKFLKD